MQILSKLRLSNKKKLYIKLILFVGVLVSSFQNCAPGFSTIQGTLDAPSAKIDMTPDQDSINDADPEPDSLLSQLPLPVGKLQLPSEVQTHAISYGAGHGCGISSSLEVYCWGDNSRGQIGIGIQSDGALAPQKVQGLSNVTSVATGNLFNCATTTTGEVLCWGANFYGNLGPRVSDFSAVPIAIVGIQNAVSVSAGDSHACALLSTGEIKCWGANTKGQLGNQTMVSSNLPVSVFGINNAISVQTSTHDASCAVLIDGDIKCWGLNDMGSILAGSTANQLTPILIPGIDSAVDIAMGVRMFCALLSDGKVKCWGYGFYTSQTFEFKQDPFEMVDFANVKKIEFNSRGGLCALIQNGEVKCNGMNQYANLGIGSIDNSFHAATTVTGLTNASSLSVNGNQSSCVVTSNFEVFCWGTNSYGGLGNGNSVNLLATKISGLTNVASVQVGPYSTLAVLRTGEVYSIGFRSFYRASPMVMSQLSLNPN